MAITIHGGMRFGPWSLDAGNGEVEARTSAHTAVTFPGMATDRDFHAFALTWTSAPAGARIAQTIAFRGFGLRRDEGLVVPIRPEAPHTDISPYGGAIPAQSLSPYPGLLRWYLDVAPVAGPPDPGRAYVTDADDPFAQRVGNGISFVDEPFVFFRSPTEIAARQLQYQHRWVEWLRLVASFETHLFVGAARVGVVMWKAYWQGAAPRYALLHNWPRYSEVRFEPDGVAEGSTAAEVMQLIRRWQGTERRRRWSRGVRR